MHCKFKESSVCHASIARLMYSETCCLSTVAESTQLNLHRGKIWLQCGADFGTGPWKFAAEFCRNVAAHFLCGKSNISVLYDVVMAGDTCGLYVLKNEKLIIKCKSEF